RQVGAFAAGTLEQPIDQCPRATTSAMRRLRGHGAQPDDADGPAVEDRGEIVDFRAGEDLAGADQCPPVQVRAAPRRSTLSGVVAAITRRIEAVVPDVERGRKNLVENGSFSRKELESHIFGQSPPRFRPRPGRALVIVPLSSTISPLTMT